MIRLLISLFTLVSLSLWLGACAADAHMADMSGHEEPNAATSQESTQGTSSDGASGSDTSNAGNSGGAGDDSDQGPGPVSPGSSESCGAQNDSESEPVSPEDPNTPPEDEEETPTWIQLSTDDSTSMASAQMYKANFHWQALKAHEFINYYDAPSGLFEAEEWAVQDSVAEDIEFGVKADLIQVEAGPMIDCEAGDDCESSEPYQVAEVLFQMKAQNVQRESRRNWNVFLCVDVSGSMSGNNIHYVRNALTTMLTHFKEGDVLTLVTFDSNYHDIFLNWEFSSNEDAIRDAFLALAPGSSTNMIAGLNRVYDLAQENFDDTKLQRVILFGDGIANVGNTDLETFNNLTRINGQEGIYLSGVGVGTNYEWERMDELTDAGKGAHIFLPNSQEVELMFGDYFPKLVEVSADQVAIEMELPAGVVLEGFSGEETSTDPEQRLQNIILAAGDDMTFIARFKINREEALNEPVTLRVKLRPLSSGDELVHEVTVAAFSELVATPGALFERTRVVSDFATVVTGSNTSGVELEDILDTLENFGPLDWGLQEIQGLLQ